MVDLPRRELSVSMRAALPLWLPVLLAGALAVVVGSSGGASGARLALAFVGVTAIGLTLGALLRPPTLVLDADTLAFRTPVGERWRVGWDECGGFRVHQGFVVWESAGEAERHPRRAAMWRKRADADAGLAPQFGGLSAPDLAALLNRYRSAASRTP